MTDNISLLVPPLRSVFGLHSPGSWRVGPHWHSSTEREREREGAGGAGGGAHTVCEPRRALTRGRAHDISSSFIYDKIRNLVRQVHSGLN